MKITYGGGRSEYGPGVNIELTGDDVAVAIDAWLVANRINVQGPRTIITTEYDRGTGSARVYVDPSGWVGDADGKEWSGRGPGHKP